MVATIVACHQGGESHRATPAAPPTETAAAHDVSKEQPVSLAVVTAVDYEFRAVREALTAPQISTIGGREVVDGTVVDHRVVAIRAGWGKAHAAGATALLLERYHPQRVLMAGIAGGLVADAANSGDVVIVDGTFQHDLGRAVSSELMPWEPESPTGAPLGPLFRSPPPLLQAMWTSLATMRFDAWTMPAHCSCDPSGAPKDCTGAPRRVGRDSPRVCVGVAATGDVFLADPAAAARIAVRAHGVIVDMETAAVAQECTNHGVPFAAIRVVADVVSQDGESRYNCLKPFTGARLAAVMRAMLPALVEPPPTSDVQPMACAANLSVAAVEKALQNHQLESKTRNSTNLQLR